MSARVSLTPPKEEKTRKEREGHFMGIGIELEEGEMTDSLVRKASKDDSSFITFVCYFCNVSS